MSEENVVEGVAVAEVYEAEVIAMDDIQPHAPDRVAVETAKAHPRSIEAFRKELGVLATIDKESADTMYYGIRRGGKVLEGPSVRFAECILSAYGNVQVFGRVVEVGASTLVAEAAAWDMEKNTRIGKRVTRRITDRNGRRFSDDMIGVTSNAAISIAVRNAVLAIVPRPLWQAAYNASLATAVGDAKSFGEYRKKWRDWWVDEMGGTEEDMWLYLDVKGPDDIGGFGLRRLAGMKTAITEGHTTFQRELDLLHGGQIPEDEAADLDAKIMQEAKRG
jgi:hypothetical protein